MLPTRFPYTSPDNLATSLMPRLALTLRYGSHVLEIVGLLDTGAAVNVLPYSAGLQLGAVWDEELLPVRLVGSLGRYEARALVVQAAHPQLTPESSVQLAFAWTRAPDAPVIFGQMNFFMAFEVCFFRSQGIFEVKRSETR